MKRPLSAISKAIFVVAVRLGLIATAIIFTSSAALPQATAEILPVPADPACSFLNPDLGNLSLEDAPDMLVPQETEQPLINGSVVEAYLLETAAVNEETQPRYERALGIMTELVQFWNPNVTSSELSFQLVETEMLTSGPVSVLLPLEVMAEGAVIMGRSDVASVAVTALAEINPAAAAQLCSEFRLGDNVAQIAPELTIGEGMLGAIGATRAFLLEASPLRTEIGSIPLNLKEAVAGPGSALAAYSTASPASFDMSTTGDKPDSMECRMTCHDEATNESTWTAVYETFRHFGEDLWKIGQPDPEDENDVDVTPFEVAIDAGRKASEEADEVYDERYKACVQISCGESATPPSAPPEAPMDDTPEMAPLSVNESLDGDQAAGELPPELGEEPTCNPQFEVCLTHPTPTDNCQIEGSENPTCGGFVPSTLPEFPLGLQP